MIVELIKRCRTLEGYRSRYHKGTVGSMEGVANKYFTEFVFWYLLVLMFTSQELLFQYTVGANVLVHVT